MPSRALLKFMEKERFDYLTFVRSSGGCCEWCSAENFIYHMEMHRKQNYSFDVCHRCMVELQPILENYDESIQEFKDVLKRNKSLWQNKSYHLHNSTLDSLLDDIEDEGEVINDEALSDEDYNNEYMELSKADIVLYRKPIEVGQQFTKDSPELPKSEITDMLIYDMIMNYHNLIFIENRCADCDICKGNTKLYIVIYTTEKEKKRKIETEWVICVKCIYRFDYLIASYLINKWDMIKECQPSKT